MLDCTSVIESVGGFGPGLVSTPAIIRRKTITGLKKIFKNWWKQNRFPLMIYESKFLFCSGKSSTLHVEAMRLFCTLNSVRQLFNRAAKSACFL